MKVTRLFGVLDEIVDNFSPLYIVEGLTPLVSPDSVSKALGFAGTVLPLGVEPQWGY